MAINPNDSFPTKTAAPSAEYPYGSARNITTPGDGTGTPWRAEIVNDIFGFQQALLDAAGVVPSGQSDEVGASQYLESARMALGAVVQSIADLQDLEPVAAGQKAFLSDGGRSGDFIWTLGDFTSEVAVDALQGVYIASDFVAASVGCWVRDWDGVNVQDEWFGATDNLAVDSAPAINAALELLDFVGGGVVHTPTSRTLLSTIDIKRRTKWVSPLALGVVCTAYHTSPVFRYHLGSWMSTSAGVYGMLLRKGDSSFNGTDYRWTGDGCDISDTYGFEIKCNFASCEHPITLRNQYGWTEGTVIDSQSSNSWKGLRFIVDDQGSATNSFGYTQIQRLEIFFDPSKYTGSTGVEFGEYGNAAASAIGGSIYNSTLNISVWGRDETVSYKFAENFFVSNCAGSWLNETSTSVDNALLDYETPGRCGFYGVMPLITNSSAESDDDGLEYPEVLTSDGVIKRVQVYNRFQGNIWVHAVDLFRQNGSGNYSTFIGAIKAMGDRGEGEATIIDFIVRYGDAALNQTLWDVKGSSENIGMRVYSKAADSENQGLQYEVWLKVPAFSANYMCEYSASKFRTINADGIYDIWTRYDSGYDPSSNLDLTLVYDTADEVIVKSAYRLEDIGLSDADFSGLTTVAEAFAVFDAVDNFTLEMSVQGFTAHPNLTSALGLTSSSVGNINHKNGVLRIYKPSSTTSIVEYQSAQGVAFKRSTLALTAWSDFV